MTNSNHDSICMAQLYHILYYYYTTNIHHLYSISATIKISTSRAMTPPIGAATVSVATWLLVPVLELGSANASMR